MHKEILDMPTKYIKFELSPGQMAPTGSTGISLSDGYIVWVGEAGGFKKDAVFGRLTPQDPTPADTYIYEEMSPGEIDEYNDIVEVE